VHPARCRAFAIRKRAEGLNVWLRKSNPSSPSPPRRMIKKCNAVPLLNTGRRHPEAATIDEDGDDYDRKGKQTFAL